MSVEELRVSREIRSRGAVAVIGMATSCLGVLVMSGAVAQTLPEAPKWQMYEVSLAASGSPANPFTDTTLTATVTRPTGASFVIDGFYDGDGNGGQSGNVWRLRFSPDEPGVWQWTTSSNDVGLDNQRGQFECVASAEPGPIVANGRHFSRADGGPLYLIGNFLDPVASSREEFSHTLLSEEISETNRQNMIARHRDFHRANKMNVYLANDGDYGDISTTPWVGSDDSNDKTRFDLSRWAMYDRIISQLGDEGMIAELWLFADDSGFGSLSDADRQRLIKYGMARLSAYPHTMFVLCLEWQEGWSTSEVSSHMAYGQYHNPWNRLWSVHGGTGDFAFPGESWADFMATQSGNSIDPPNNNDHGVYNRRLANKPLIMEEFGRLDNTSDRRLRGNLWACFCGGGAGSGTGSDLPRLRKFIEDLGFEFWNMHPDNALTSQGFALANPGNEYVVYVETGGTFSVQLAPGTCHAEWFSPRQADGDAGPIPIGTVTGETQDFTTPDSDDWVLHIKRKADTDGDGIPAIAEGNEGSDSNARPTNAPSAATTTGQVTKQKPVSQPPSNEPVQGKRLPRIETYVTPKQLESRLATDEDRENALRVFRMVEMSKVYLDALRSGHSPDRQLVVDTRDFFVRHGLEVSGGITTTSGKDFGTPSSQTSIFLNYESKKTRDDMSSGLRSIAPLFDEFIVDDFFASDDMSEIAIEAKKGRSWSAYRMDLLTDFAQRCVIDPIRGVNPDAKIIIKYPQWYDRFHQFGYDVVREPEMFDGVWVGTETRDPETDTYGYVVPTEGFINYCWLQSIAKEKTGGAWFDFHDCPPPIYLMQAYQSVLAGAERLILFDTASLLEVGAPAQALISRIEAVSALGTLLHGRQLLGMAAYKPPHSEGSDSDGGANLFIYDYVATLGLSPVMTAELPESSPVVFLSGHAAADPRIGQHFRRWLARGSTIVVTPDFLRALHDSEVTAIAGYADPLLLDVPEKTVTRFRVDGRQVSSSSPVQLRALSLPKDAEVLCAGITNEGDIPVLTKRKTNDGGSVIVLNVATFTHDEIEASELLLLPPRPLTIKDWPRDVVNRIRRAIPSPSPLHVDAPNNVGIYHYDGNILVLASFNEAPAHVTLTWLKGEANKLRLDSSFPHTAETRAEKNDNGFIVTVAPWELAVVRW